MFNKLLTKLMIPNQLMRVLKDVQEKCTNQVSNLNNGGCGVFAYLVCKELTAIGIKAEVVTTSDTKEYSPRNVKNKNWTKKERASCDAWDSNGLDRTHVGVRFKYGRMIFTYDSDALRHEARAFGRKSRGKWRCNYPFGEGMTYKEMKKLVDDKHYWNSMFDRKQIPLVKNIVKEQFKSLKV